MSPSFIKKLLAFFIIPILSGLILYLFLLSVSETRAAAATTSVLVVISVCGDGLIGGGEVCDEGANNGTYSSSAANRYCSSDCLGWAPYCGDETVQAANGEECDDGNNASGDGCRSDCQSEAVSPPPVQGGAGVVVPPSALVILRGKAYPKAIITVLIDGKVGTIIEADSQANFKVELTTLTAGVYTFGLRAKDTEGKKSSIFSFTVNVTKGVTTNVLGIFLLPTIEIEKTDVKRGETFNVSGQTAPGSEVSIYVGPPGQELIKKTKAKADGKWSYSFDTSLLDRGDYSIKTKAVSPGGLISDFSQALPFFLEWVPGVPGVPEVPVERIPITAMRGDLNQDGKVDLVDFSILLHWWETDDKLADLNGDGAVDLVDLSIVMYFWTG